MSLYSLKNSAAGAVQQWSQVITLAEAGKGCDGLFNLYDSLGDQTLVGAHTIATLLDGPEKVVRYGALTLGDGTTPTSLTASLRCKGLTVICDSLTVRASATLHMTGKGARVLTNDDPFYPFDDYKIPFRITLASSRMTLAQALAVIKTQGLAPWDRGTFQHLVSAMYGYDLSVSLVGSLSLMLASGGGGGGGGGIASAGTHVPGGVGSAGSSGGGGGGGGGAASQYGTSTTAYGRTGSQGCPYSGGCGGGAGSAYGGYAGTNGSAPTAGRYSGPGGGGGIHWTSQGIFPGDAGGGAGGGGAGNPGGRGAGSDSTGGNGCGGKLTIICRGTVNIQSGGKIEANGMAGGSGIDGGGGSGGGHISLISPSAPSNSGTVQAAGGAGGSGGQPGGAGGAGSVVTKTFSNMGW